MSTNILLLILETEVCSCFPWKSALSLASHRSQVRRLIRVKHGGCHFLTLIYLNTVPRLSRHLNPTNLPGPHQRLLQPFSQVRKLSIPPLSPRGTICLSPDKHSSPQHSSHWLPAALTDYKFSDTALALHCS